MKFLVNKNRSNFSFSDILKFCLSNMLKLMYIQQLLILQLF